MNKRKAISLTTFLRENGVNVKDFESCIKDLKSLKASRPFVWITEAWKYNECGDKFDIWFVVDLSIKWKKLLNKTQNAQVIWEAK